MAKFLTRYNPSSIFELYVNDETNISFTYYDDDTYKFYIKYHNNIIIRKISNYKKINICNDEKLYYEIYDL